MMNSLARADTQGLPMYRLL